MKNILFGLAVISILVITLSATTTETSPLKKYFITGDPGIASVDQLAFGPEGILFIGDSESAAVFAIDTKDLESKAVGGEISIDGFDGKIASSLGTTKDQIAITDMAVNPVSKTVYFSVKLIDGTPVLLKLVDGLLENVPLKDLSFSKIGLADPVAADAVDHRERPLRKWTISDMQFHKGNVLVSGLSNKEFGSTFRSIPFPFNDTQDYATLEIWHAAHGKFETHAPVKTFDVIQLDSKDYIMASYTCTPLVLFPLDELKDGAHTKGRTVAELGAGNSPIDMISYEKEGQKFFLMSNSDRPVMRIKYKNIAAFQESLTDPVTEFAATKGVAFDNLPFPYVLQMDKLDPDNVVYIQRTAEGDLVLKSRTTKWM